MSRKIILTLLVIVIGVAIYTFMRPASKPQPKKIFTAARSSSTTVEKKPSKPVEYGWQNDPFARIPSMEKTTSVEGEELKLTGILWDKQGGIALINDSIVRVGDRIGQWKVMKITPSSVILERAGTYYELKLGAP